MFIIFDGILTAMKVATEIINIMNMTSVYGTKVSSGISNIWAKFAEIRSTEKSPAEIPVANELITMQVAS